MCCIPWGTLGAFKYAQETDMFEVSMFANQKAFGAVRVAQEVKHLPRKSDALSSDLNSTKKVKSKRLLSQLTCVFDSYFQSFFTTSDFKFNKQDFMYM
jgi:hypothetical protein